MKSSHGSFLSSLYNGVMTSSHGSFLSSLYKGVMTSSRGFFLSSLYKGVITSSHGSFLSSLYMGVVVVVVMTRALASRILKQCVYFPLHFLMNSFFMKILYGGKTKKFNVCNTFVPEFKVCNSSMSVIPLCLNFWWATV